MAMVAIVLKLSIEEPKADTEKLPMFPRKRDIERHNAIRKSQKWKVPDSASAKILPSEYKATPVVNVCETQRFDCPLDIKVRLPED
jgi:hypothetical protein